jgi:hypothetical protein
VPVESFFLSPASIITGQHHDVEPISQDRGRDLVTANNRGGIVAHNFASQLDISKLNGVALIRAGVGDFLGVDLFGMVAELRLHMMSLVYAPFSWGTQGRGLPKRAAARRGEKGHENSSAMFQEICWGNRKSRTREALRHSQTAGHRNCAEAMP